MDLSPWNYWTPDRQPREHTLEMLDVLEAVLAARPDHVGANHFYIHAVEMPYPERGVAAAERLRTLAPDAGHLVHMPSHIFWRVGRYDDALEVNRSALRSDERFFATCRAGPYYRTAYYAHNLHFLWAAAAAEGRSEVALTTARQLEAESAAGIESYPFLEEQLAVPILTLARFGRWDALLAAAQPPASRVYLTGIWHYARGLALVRTGRASEAPAELAALDALPGEAAAELLLSGGVASAAQLLAIGSRHLAGELAAVDGRHRRRSRRARGRGRAPGRDSLHGAAAVVFPDASGARRGAARGAAARRRRGGGVPRRSRALPAQRLVAVRARGELARAAQARRSRVGAAGLRGGMGARRRRAARVALLAVRGGTRPTSGRGRLDQAASARRRCRPSR